VAGRRTVCAVFAPPSAGRQSLPLAESCWRHTPTLEALSRPAEIASSKMPTTTIDSLPDEALVHCLSYLTQGERCSARLPASPAATTARPSTLLLHLPPARPALCPSPHSFSAVCRLGKAVLVSRRFAALACSPGLLRRVSVPWGGAAPAVMRAQSLLQWLAKHARHMHSLTFHGLVGIAENPIQLTELYDSCMVGCCAAAPLQHLSADVEAGAFWPHWLPGLSGTLQHLHIDSGYVATACSLRELTALRLLEIDGNGTACMPNLPPALTSLKLRNVGFEDLPTRVGGCWRAADVLLTCCLRHTRS
jgi:hypothetical protein